MVSARRRIAVLLAVGAVGAAGTTASGYPGPARPASAVAQAYAIQDAAGKRTDFVKVDGNGDRSGGRTTRAYGDINGARGAASAAATVKDVDLFEGLVTAETVKVLADATDAGTSTSGSITKLVIDGQPVDSPTARTVYDLAGYGKLVALDSGATGVLGLRARLDKPYKSHKAGEVVRVAYASAKAQDAVTPRATVTSPKKPDKKTKAGKKRAHRRGPLTPLQKVRAAVDNPRDRLWQKKLLAAGGYAFPVAGAHQFTDTFGAARSDVPVHVGNDIFAAFGTPIVAVADGRIYRVGTLPISGNRLWLRDRNGYRYFYCHLSDFAAAAYNGAEVHAGEVIGFVGNTGDAEPTPPHLHFEVHLPDDKVVGPYRYLHKWDEGGVSSASWIRRYGKDPGVRPGALVVVRDFLAQS